MKRSASLLSANNTKPHDFIVIGTPGDRRVELFQQALLTQGLPPAHVISYLDLLTNKTSITDSLTTNTIVRIESPGKNQSVERAILAHGANIEDPEGERYERISHTQLSQLPTEKGLLLPSRQWYLGYHSLLQQVNQQLHNVPLMNRPADILLMFDKRACHAHLQHNQIPAPHALPPIHSYEELMQRLHDRGWSRVFLKPTHGSSASGVIAYRFQKDNHQAITSLEMIQTPHGVRFYNSRRIRTYTSIPEIARLINALCRHRLHVERWIPKASYAGSVFDCRIVVITGQAQHAVARLSKSPMTNLHLGAQRGDVATIRATLGEENWQAGLQSCEKAARLFSNLYTGIDLLFHTNYRTHAILEMNAFGDLLPGILYQNQDTYTAEIQAVLKTQELSKVS